MSLLPILKAVKGLLKKIHHAIPPGLRNVYMPAASQCLYFFENHWNAVFPLVTLYEGFEKNTQKPFMFAYAGNLRQMHTYWDHIILADGYRQRSVRRRFFWNISGRIKKEFPGCGLLFCELSPLTAPYFQSKPGFPIPNWINTEIDIEPPMKELLGDQRSDIERRIRKNGLSYEMTKDPKQFDDFYHRMYVPYLKNRYADAASVNPYEVFTKLKPSSELLLIKKDGQTIAAAFIVFKKDEVSLLKLGILDSNMEYMRYGSIGAMYYFLIQEIKKRGHKLLYIGGCRPLLSDGLMKFKISMGARLCKNNFRHSCINLMVLNLTDEVKSFLVNNPFLFRDKNRKICRALFLDKLDPSQEKSLKDKLKSSYCPGIAQTDLYVLDGQTAAATGPFSEGVHVLPGVELTVS